MKHLLDVNALVALAHRLHVHHARALAWFQATKSTGDSLDTCEITELGFVHVAVQTGLQSDVASARKALEQLKKSSPVPFELLAGDAAGVPDRPAAAGSYLRPNRVEVYPPPAGKLRGINPTGLKPL